MRLLYWEKGKINTRKKDPDSNCKNLIVFLNKWVVGVLKLNSIIKRLTIPVNCAISRQGRPILSIEMGGKVNTKVKWWLTLILGSNE